MMDSSHLSLALGLVLGYYVILVSDVIFILIHIARVVHSLRGPQVLLTEHLKGFLPKEFEEVLHMIVSAR